MKDKERCRSCDFNPGYIERLGTTQCEHVDFKDNVICPLEEEEAYDIAYKAGVDFGIKGVQIALLKLLEGVQDTPANEIMNIIAEFTEAL